MVLLWTRCINLFVGCLLMNKRLDLLVAENNMVKSREMAKELIKKSKVTVDGKVITKPSAMISEESIIIITGEVLSYVGRGGLKLEQAISEFNLSFTDKVCMDIGASTGGFTDCMLQNGAKKVYAVDVGHDQLAEKLLNDRRVINLEKTNIRTFEKEQLNDIIDFISIDVSFISLKLVLPKVKELISQKGEVVALIKPQFEATKSQLNKKGILKDKNIHISILKDIISFCRSMFTVKGLCFSPIKGGDGNIEYLVHLSPEGENAHIDEGKAVSSAFEILKGGLKE